jgi:hypothetical protein
MGENYLVRRARQASRAAAKGTTPLWRLPYWFLSLFSNKTFGRQTLHTSKHLETECSSGASCRLSKTAPGCMGLETCCMPASNIVAIPAAGGLFTCQSAFVHAHLTSNRLQCCQKRPRVHGHAHLALPRTCSGGDKYLPRCRWSRWPIFSFQSPNTTNGVLASP